MPIEQVDNREHHVFLTVQNQVGQYDDREQKGGIDGQLYFVDPLVESAGASRFYIRRIL